MKPRTGPTLLNQLFAWLIHLFTASGAIVGLFAIYAAFHHYYQLVFWLMAVAVAIDAMDGALARLVRVKEVLPNFDGALLDNMIDYLNYAIVPAALALVGGLFTAYWGAIAAIIITLCSAYQFCQADAKTDDNFFKGFPSYWNIAIFYMFCLQKSNFANVTAILIMGALSFIPIKYIYPTRLDYFSNNKLLRQLMLASVLLWGGSILMLLWQYPKHNLFLVTLSLTYVGIYGLISLYRTIVPLAQINSTDI